MGEWRQVGWRMAETREKVKRPPAGTQLGAAGAQKGTPGHQRLTGRDSGIRLNSTGKPKCGFGAQTTAAPIFWGMPILRPLPRCGCPTRL
jgi:hypothetical protein